MAQQRKQTKTKIEKDRQVAVDIAHEAREIASEWITDREFMASLPASTRGQLLLQFLPKVQPVDQDLEKNVLSLTDLLKDLPDSQELTKELTACKNKINALETQMKLMKRRQKIWRKKGVEELGEDVVAALEAAEYKWVEEGVKLGHRMAGSVQIGFAERECWKELKSILKP